MSQAAFARGWRALGIAAVLGAGVLAQAAPASAQSQSNLTFLGSGGIITNRPCPSNGPLTCDIAANPRNFTRYFGGITAFSTSPYLIGTPNGGSGQLYALAANLPLLGAASVAGPDDRTGATVTMFEVFQYAQGPGVLPINLSMKAGVDYYTSGDLFAGDHAGEGTVGATLAVTTFQPFQYWFNNQSTTTGRDIVNSIPTSFPDCSMGTTLGYGFVDSTGRSSVPSMKNSLSAPVNECRVGSMRIQPGQTYVIVATLQAISNRGGWADAFHTMDVQFDEANTTFLDGTPVPQGYLSATMSSQVASVPEPATWASLLLGIGALGGLARRRRAAAAA